MVEWSGKWRVVDRRQEEQDLPDLERSDRIARCRIRIRIREEESGEGVRTHSPGKEGSAGPNERPNVRPDLVVGERSCVVYQGRKQGRKEGGKKRTKRQSYGMGFKNTNAIVPQTNGREKSSITPTSHAKKKEKEQGTTTHERPNSSQELRLHRLSLRKPAPDEDTVVRDLVWDLMREAGEGRRGADERA